MSQSYTFILLMEKIDFDKYSFENSQKPSNEKDQKQKKKKKLPKKALQIQVDPVQTLNKILSYRKDHIAPVDTMGCQRLAEKNQPTEIQKYQTLISLMLSIQTKDQTTSMCVLRLQKFGLTPQKIAQTDEQKIRQMVYECNFNKRKAKNIKQVSQLIFAKGIARTKQDLLKYPGVGIKIAMIYLNVAEGKQEGIGVDTHVHRICNKLGWVHTSTPNETEEKLQYKFDVKYWSDINIAMVGFGQILCKAKKPLCAECPVKRQCPSSQAKSQFEF